MIVKLQQKIKEMLKHAGYDILVEITMPPDSKMGDIAIPCFVISKEFKLSPQDAAMKVAEIIVSAKDDLFEQVEVAGPYVNIQLAGVQLAKDFFSELKDNGSAYGMHTLGSKEKIMLEFAHPNTHKAFHIGHLRNIITGESLVRIFENSGHQVIRANYQGDVGMHIAKCLWGIQKLSKEYDDVADSSVFDKVAFLGKAYAEGARNFEEDLTAKKEIVDLNGKIYHGGDNIKKLYEETRAWSLEYFNAIYSRLGTHFDRLYFESEVADRAVELVKENTEKGVFKESQGAVIFEGSKFDLHDRVFLNSKGFPTYEGKDLALAELQFKEQDPKKIIHITGREQAEYFKVIFKAIEQVFPKTVGKEEHLVYGWVDLKHGKMSSRTGKVVLATWLLDQVKEKIQQVMEESTLADKDIISEKVTLAAVKYALLKTGRSNDIIFDIDESISTSGDSGTYLLYNIARIKSILREVDDIDFQGDYPTISDEERKLLLKLSLYPESTLQAYNELDPSKIAKYLFELGQIFNKFYHACPVIKANEDNKLFRISLIKAVLQIMEHGLAILGINTVEEM